MIHPLRCGRQQIDAKVFHSCRNVMEKQEVIKGTWSKLHFFSQADITPLQAEGQEQKGDDECLSFQA